MNAKDGLWRENRKAGCRVQQRAPTCVEPRHEQRQVVRLAAAVDKVSHLGLSHQ